MYVDDLLIFHNNRSAADAFKKSIMEEFKCTDEGQLSWHLGIKYERDRARKIIDCSQEQYIDDLLA
eukprot:136866-Rhodomonas_salina.1